jgi:hypothetical protein
MYPRLIHPHEGIVVGQDDLQGGVSNLKGDPCLVLTADPKPRLRWTQDLHERFVDAVTQLGGPSSKSFFFIFSIFFYFFIIFNTIYIYSISFFFYCYIFFCVLFDWFNIC